MRIHSMSVLAASFILALASLAPAPAQAQADSAQPAAQDSSSTPIGKVVTVAGSVTIEHVNAVVVQANVSGQASQTKVGDLVYLGDVVLTGADGRVGINFADGTSFSLSRNARMALTEFVYAPHGKSNSSLLTLTKGTFTFVAGNIAKTGDMKIDTPVATMGIRGTTPHIEISDDGTVKFATLIEEGKTKIVKKFKAPAAQPPEQRVDHTFNPRICRGC
ncbi:FecR domain-containing protein [Bradyrhizobium sp. ISRA443]|uniref:FecR family protein n=1 Tax=unclassified Bradyrhizobium TaxID=2631580 RepID=UPI00247B1D24|nr:MULTISPECIES: FecR domain-containing protein [unclassified Bradyrhizobium]WGS01657.1 FecR domain-containing protein [Bradyrhizobium sp. ISRA436]WGS08543.1 FecR domain-containing protein [Bradyrhizobium sp. ISRA437]WGS15431.1 FecR domain-containing protein [Bradyrhizobium sp. ISRA443]